MSDGVMTYEDWLRGCVHHDGRHGYVTLPCDEVLKIADFIEELRADCKTENSSEKPNNFEDLQDWKDRMWAEAIVTEPTISKMEQVDEPQTMVYPQVDGITPSVIEPQTGKMMTEEEFDSMLARVLIGKDEPQTSGTPYKIETSSVCKDEPQTDCAWRRDNA